MLFSLISRTRLRASALVANTRTPLLFAAAAVLLVSGICGGPAALAQATASGGVEPPTPSRVDLYAGYGYFRPVRSAYEPINPGAVASITGYFNRYIGLQAEGSVFPHGPNDCVSTAQAGPVIRVSKNRFVPFAHALFGTARVGGPGFQGCNFGYGGTAGLGFDYILPAFGNHIALRPVQADYNYSHVNYSASTTAGGTIGGVGKVNALRLSAGLVLRLGAVSGPPPVQLGCSVQPVDVLPGDPIQITAVPANLNAKRTAAYRWSSTGGKITGTGETVTLATAGLAPGDYNVNGHVSQGIRPGMTADCAAGFRVQGYEAPTISCSAAPRSVMPGQTTTITTTARSPQNRPLTYSYTASSGKIDGTGATVTLATAGDTPGAVSVTCTAVDDAGHQVSAITTVAISAPPVPVAPSVRSLCTLSFNRDRRRPVRVDNEAKGCLDDIALTLNRESGARLVIVGNHGADETPEAAAERTLNVQQYLADEKGIDPGRIDLRTGDTPGRTVANTLVPAGATFDAGSSATFDGSSVKRRGQAYDKVRSGKKAH